MHFLMLLLLSFTCNTTAEPTDWLCSADLCSVCTPSTAICETNTLDESFLESLYSDITYLSLKFTPIMPGMKNISENKLKRFKQLETLELSGEFGSIEAGAFDHLTELKNLSISVTKIASLPDLLLKNSLKLEKLELRDNPLVLFPFSAFSRVSFGFDLRIIINGRKAPVRLFCEDNDGDARFPPRYDELFNNITSLFLVGLDIQVGNCSTAELSVDLFAPFQWLKVLDVSSSNFFVNNSALLSSLHNLESLYASGIAPYKNCPNDAMEFFKNLPKSLKSAEFLFWETLDPVNESCAFTAETLSPLGDLPLLERLVFRYQDYAFGAELDASIIPPMRNLTVLELAYCGITQVYNLSTLVLPKLKELVFSGNPVGSRRYYAPSIRLVSDTITTLHAAQSAIWSNALLDYDLTQILERYPNVTFLNLSHNFLDKPPVYRLSSEVSKLTHLILNSNLISSTATLSNNDSQSICTQFPNLTTISISDNNLNILDGMCTQIRQLYLVDNFLTNDTVTVDTISGLINLEVLDLTNNNFSPTPKLLERLTKLRDINLSNNHVYDLPDDFFRTNLLLTRINLEANHISIIKAEFFSHLESLEYLTLSANLISIYPESLLNHIESTPSIKTVNFGTSPLDCSCSKQYFQTWVRNTEKIADDQVRNLRCTTPSALTGEYVANYDYDTFECDIKIPLIVVFSIVGAVIVSVILAISCYKYSWYIRHIKVVSEGIIAVLNAMKQEHVCDYDAYVSFNDESQEDCEWVVNHLMPAIQEHQPGKVESFECYNILSYCELYTLNHTQVKLKL